MSAKLAIVIDLDDLEGLMFEYLDYLGHEKDLLLRLSLSGFILYLRNKQQETNNGTRYTDGVQGVLRQPER